LPPQWDLNLDGDTVLGLHPGFIMLVGFKNVGFLQLEVEIGIVGLVIRQDRKIFSSSKRLNLSWSPDIRVDVPPYLCGMFTFSNPQNGLAGGFSRIRAVIRSFCPTHSVSSSVMCPIN
jgi:hypothetical protein